MKYKEITVENFLYEIHKIHPSLPEDKVAKAFEIAKEAHKNQKRQSGEEYIIHPLHVSYFLAEMHLDLDTVIAGIMHDVVEDTDWTLSDIEREFSITTARLVDGVTKIEKFDFGARKSKAEKQAENFRKMLFSITKDVRVIIIKLADRLHNMRTLHFTPEEKQKRIAKETLDIYTPLANRFGLANLRFELEDLSLKFLHPSIYKKIAAIVADKKDNRENYINSFIPTLDRLLKNEKIEAIIQGRNKHFYSIYRKNLIRKVPYDEIYDLAAIRIQVDTIPQCYLVLGIIHQEFEHIDRIRDYIAKPKANGYQSLHTIIIGSNQKNVEVQIRTKEMHHIAEEGVAAHWKYKTLKSFDDKDFAQTAKETHPSQQKFDSQVQWIKSILKHDHKTIHTLVDDLQTDLFPDIIIVITPEGDFVELPKGSTPIDFAFSVHTEVGLRCIGAKVNGVIVPLRTELNSSDKVEIITANKPRASKDWLQFLKSSHAKTKLRNYFSKIEKDEFSSVGKEQFDRKFCRGIDKVNEIEIQEILRQLHFNDIKTLYYSLGKNDISYEDINEIIKRLRETKDEIKQEMLSQEQLEESWVKNLRKSADGIVIENINDLLFRYAKCCNPIPGDEIVGYTTNGRGITIHKVSCSNPNFKRLIVEKSPRLIPVNWNYSTEKVIDNTTFRTKIRISGERNKNFLLEILNYLSNIKVEVERANLDYTQDFANATIELRVHTKKEKQDLIKDLKKFDGVFAVKA